MIWVARQHEFAHQVHKPIEECHVDPNCRILLRDIAACLVERTQDFFDFGLRHCTGRDENLADRTRIARFLRFERANQIFDLDPLSLQKRAPSFPSCG